MKWSAVALVAALTGCTDPGGQASATTALDACNRSDVQEAVGKELRGILYKAALPHIATEAIFGLIDPDRFAQSIEDADVTFSRIRLGHSGAGKSTACIGNVKIDASNATAGQDVVQIKRLAWHITFADGDGDFSSANFTVEVDPDSIVGGMAINGKAVRDIIEAQQASEQPPTDEVSEAVQAASDAPDAEQAHEQAQTDGEHSGSESPVQSSEPTNEDLYAPHLN